MVGGGRGGERQTYRDGEQKEGGRDRDTGRKTDRKRQREADRKTKCSLRWDAEQGR